MSAAHTPGPWLIRQGDEWTRDVVTDHGELPDGSRNHWNVASANIQREECVDNLRLIAAAPDLLEALKACAGICAGESMSKSSLIRALEMARSAIAKATGAPT